MNDQPDLPGLSRTALRVLREDQPDQRELDAAYRQFARGSQRRAPGLLVSRWLLAGLVMGLGMAFGANAVVQGLQAATPSERSRPVSPAVPKAMRLGAPTPRRPEIPEPTLDPVPAVAEPKATHAPRSAAPRPAADHVEEPAADSAVWAKAAQGLRNNDFAETQAALATLEHAGSATDREAARLIRAQLMLHQGDTSGAQALLRDLASNAQSAQVRAKARGLLTQSAAKSNSALNVAPSGT